MPVEPKLAATVILLREREQDLESGDDCEFEVFMVKRHGNRKFLGEHHAFPGGGIDKQDISKESLARLLGLDKISLKSYTNICEDPSCLWIIAIRELFEETGILLATEESGSLITINDNNLQKFRGYQEDLQKKRRNMTDILKKENLYYAANNLKYFGRLVTPALSPIRFDTQFFLCKLPPKQNINLCNTELTEDLWGSPKELLNFYKKRQIKIIFPQFSALKRLKKFITIQEVFDNSKSMFRRIQL
ncbi:MAG: hypothetical protein ACFFDN_48415 [Candidatus Hodarchaeota archaeon]